MTQQMQDLLVSYGRAVVTEAMAASKEGNDKRWLETKRELAQCRARLVDAIKKLERESNARVRLILEAANAERREQSYLEQQQ